MIHFGDITKISGNNVPIVDCACFGAPCQDLSVAGLRKGMKHEDLGDDETTRSGLFHEAIRIIKEMRSRDERNGRTGEFIRPRFAIYENVPGAFSSNKGQDFRIVLESLAQVIDKDAVIPMPPKDKWSTSGAIVGDGWSIAWRVFDAQFWGVPQRRRRISLVADFGGRCAPEILYERKSLYGHSSEGGTQRETVTTNTEGCVGTDDRKRAIGIDIYNTTLTGDVVCPITAEGHNSTGTCPKVMTPICYGISAYASNAMMSDNPHSGIYVADTSGTLDLNGGNPACNQGGIAVVCALDRAFFNQGKNALYDPQLYEDGTNPTLVAKGPSAVAYSFYPQMKAESQCLTKEIANCIVNGTNPGFHNGVVTATYVDTSHADDVVRLDEVTAPLQARDYKGGKLVQCNYIVRRLTPLECERLQGFPDGWTDIGEYIDSNGKKKKTSDSARYKALGNSIALPPWKWVLKRLCSHYERDATMASLFDGIGGFPYLWEQLNGKGSCLWASEIEEFPIAVTKVRIG